MLDAQVKNLLNNTMYLLIFDSTHFLTVSIFCSLIEYIIVAYTYRAESKKYKERKKLKRSLSTISLSSTDTQTTYAKLDSPCSLQWFVKLPNYV